MVIVWRGLGWLVPAIMIATFIGFEPISKGLGFNGIDENINQLLTMLTGGVLVALLAYWGNIRNVNTQPEPEHGMVVDGKHKGPSFLRRLFTGRVHTLFFIPIQYWSVFIIAIGVSSYHSDIREQELTKQFMASPEIGDVYLVNYKLISDDYDDEYPYSAWKVQRFTDQEIVFLVGDYLYSRSYDADKSIRSGEMFPDQIVEEDLSFITREEVREMREQKGILSITRNRK